MEIESDNSRRKFICRDRSFLDYFKRIGAQKFELICPELIKICRFCGSGTDLLRFNGGTAVNDGWLAVGKFEFKQHKARFFCLECDG